MVSSITKNRLISLRVTKFLLKDSHFESLTRWCGFSSFTMAPDDEDEEEEEEDEEEEEEDDAEAAAAAEAAR
jgi:hypothetical protein